MKELERHYKKRRREIKQRLKEFSNMKGDDIFYELCFCTLTPQSNALKCDECVKILKKMDFKNETFNLKPVLRDKTRFYRNKSKYLIHNKKNYQYIKKIINKKNPVFNKKKNIQIRGWLVNNVKGLGYKETSHLLRNIGYRNLAILDRHILKNLQNLKVIKEIPRTLTPKRYLEIEDKFYNFSKKIKIPMDELDLLFWSLETGRIFK